MNTTRRKFIKLSTASALALGTKSTGLFATMPVKPLRILILGGTGFTGPFQVKYALSRGHKVTTFNRGKSHPDELPAGCAGDRFADRGFPRTRWSDQSQNGSGAARIGQAAFGSKPPS